MASGKGPSKALIIGVIFVVAIILIGLWVVLAYNTAVSQEQDVNSGLSQIKNRYTTKVSILGPLLVQVDSYKVYESSLLTNITALRSQWYTAVNGSDASAMIQVGNALDSQFATIRATWENYPDLKTDSVVRQYMGQVVDQEEQLSYSRLQYNNAVNSFNSNIKSFPMFLLAGSFGFHEKPYWGNDTNALTL
jgi:LemA protein